MTRADRAEERAKARLISDEVMPRLGPSGWGGVDYVMHSAALMTLPVETLELVLMWLKVAHEKKAGPSLPSTSLLAKLGSVVVHVQEVLGPDGHAFDLTAIRSVVEDPEVAAWVKSMGPLVPTKRLPEGGKGGTRNART